MTTNGTQTAIQDMVPPRVCTNSLAFGFAEIYSTPLPLQRRDIRVATTGFIGAF
jgi:hypothetical protein